MHCASGTALSVGLSTQKVPADYYEQQGNVLCSMLLTFKQNNSLDNVHSPYIM